MGTQRRRCRPVPASEGFTKQITDGHNGLLYNPASPGALTDGLRRALALTETERARIRRAAHTRVVAERDSAQHLGALLARFLPDRRGRERVATFPKVRYASATNPAMKERQMRPEAQLLVGPTRTPGRTTSGEGSRMPPPPGTPACQDHQVLRDTGPDPWPGYWTPPGGWREGDESAEEAAAREVREEAGIEITGLRTLPDPHADHGLPLTRVLHAAWDGFENDLQLGDEDQALRLVPSAEVRGLHVPPYLQHYPLLTSSQPEGARP